MIKSLKDISRKQYVKFGKFYIFKIFHVYIISQFFYIDIIQQYLISRIFEKNREI